METTAGRRLRGRRGWSRRWGVLRAAVAATLPQPCAWCGAPVERGDDWHLDHIIPVAAGGTDTADNVQPLHAPCNRAKAAQVIRGYTHPAPPSRKW